MSHGYQGRAGGRLFLAAALAVGTLAGALVWARENQPSHAGTAGHEVAADTIRAADEMAEAALNFWASLTPEQQAKAHFEVNDDERHNWHFIPRVRKGLPWNEMTPSQRELGQAFLSSGLSQKGFAKVSTIMSLEQILRDVEQGKGPLRDSENYSFSVFGKPGHQETWGWRVEGHHVSLNFTIVEGHAVSGTPAFLGSNPGEVREGTRKGLRVLGPEEDLGREIVRSLSEEQKKTAILPGAAPAEIITANSRKAQIEHPAGILVSDLKPEQSQTLHQLVAAYAHRLRPELAEQDLARVEKGGWDKVRFAWAGGMEIGQPHYYRIQGPTFLIEYDNTQNNANHAHSVWRDLENDFGGDPLRQHYEESHAGAK